MARDKAVTGDGKGNKAAQNANETGNNKKGTNHVLFFCVLFLTDNSSVRRRYCAIVQLESMVQ